MCMKKVLLFLYLLICISSFSQNKYVISGKLTDSLTGEDLIGATVYVKETEKGTSTNTFGFYSIQLQEGNYTIIYKYVGYAPIIKKISLSKDEEIDVKLGKENIEIEEVVVRGKERENVESTDMGTLTLDIEEIKTLPAFLGEVDVVKSIQLLPGVQSANEGAQGFYVRGGGPDQNLVLLDEAVVYNAAHLFGFFSVFNPDGVKNVNLVKGGMPAKFGGRLASVLEVNMKEGNNQRFGVEGGLGLISSRLMVQGPLKKDKGSFMIAGRRTYIDLFMKAFIPKSSSFYGTTYYFYDINAKANYKLGKKDRIYVSGYYGRDEFNYADRDSDFNIEMPWANGIASARWNHIFSNKLFMNTTFTFSDYNFSFGSNQDEFTFKLFSGIRDYGAKIDFNWYQSTKHSFEFGAAYTYHIFTPSSVSAKSEDVEFNTGEIQKVHAHEAGIYFSDDWSVTDWFKIHLGLRYSIYQHVGPFTRFYPQDIGVGDSSVVYDRGDPIQFYHGLEPRLSMRFKTGRNSSIKAGFNYNNQYLHLASLSAISLPTDVWYPATSVAKPQKGWQAAVGYYQNFWKNKMQASVEVYYKDMRNLIEYRNGALPEDNINDNVDNLLVFGKGYSFGVELFLKKSLGKFTGWIGYTYSLTRRKFDDISDDWFPAKFDRTHDLSIVLSYKINEQWTVSSSFVFATGNTFTPAVGWYLNENDVIYEYGEKNSVRMPNYHRLDVSATWFDKPYRYKKNKETGEKVKIKKKLRSSVNISVYNVYSRTNPYFIFPSNEGDLSSGNFKISLQQVSLFPILPSVTWNFKF